MLEGDKKNNWYLWGFSNNEASYYEAQDTRSGDIASSLLKDSKCEFLVSDVFSGYNKAVRETNEYRIENNKKGIENIYCNAHARRKFKDSENYFKKESEFFLFCYRKIYRLEKKIDFKERRKWQKFYFSMMRKKAEELLNTHSLKSSIIKAVNYFLKNYKELTRFLDFEDIPIDNNPQERRMRNPVIGRKTWYGTHSRRGAETNAILFSLVESCKLNKVNPRKYFKDLVHAIHEKRDIFLPHEYQPEIEIEK